MIKKNEKCKPMYRHPSKSGFTLIELMIVVAILAVLASIGYPSYRSFVINGERAEARAVMMDIMQAQNKNFARELTYEANLSNLDGFTADTVTAGNGNYAITAAACGAGITRCVQLTATNAADTDCSPLTINSLGATTPAGCWD